LICLSAETGGIAPVRITLRKEGERGKAHLPSLQAIVVHLYKPELAAERRSVQSLGQ